MEKKSQEATLRDIYRNAMKNMSAEEQKGVDARLLTVMHLSALQLNLMGEIEHILRKNGGFAFYVKHNHKKIVSLIKGNGNEKAFFAKLSPEAVDRVCDVADELEKLIKEWAGIE